MIGLPGSGKSSIVKKIIEYHDINGIDIREISLDKIKSKSKMIKMIKEYARMNNTIIVDNTNLSSETRDEIAHYVLDIEENYYAPCTISKHFVSFYEKNGGVVNDKEEELNMLLEDLIFKRIQTNRELIMNYSKEYNDSNK
jgi:adenylate kinase family enzyme